MELELVDVKNLINGGSDTVFVVTCGRGRRKKAHVYNRESGESFCGRAGKSTKLVDAETVHRFYTVCDYCRRQQGL